MANIYWQPLPPLWPSPAVWADVGGLMLLIFTQDHVPRWEVKLARAKRRKCRVIPQARILRQFSVTGWWRRQSRQTGLRRENSQVSGNLAGN